MSKETKFKQLLEREGLNVSKIYRYIQDHPDLSVSRTALYDLSKRDPQYIDTRMMRDLLTALREMTGKYFDLSDIVDAGLFSE